MSTLLENIALVMMMILIVYLNAIPLIIMINILLRPSLWTAFNIIGLFYLWFSVILGCQKMVQMFDILKASSIHNPQDSGCFRYLKSTKKLFCTRFLHLVEQRGRPSDLLFQVCLLGWDICGQGRNPH